MLLDRGLQIHGLATKNDVFHVESLQKANYTGVTWIWDPDLSKLGAAPGFPWARWIKEEVRGPSDAERPYLKQLVALQLADELDLNNPAVRDKAVAWFKEIRPHYPNALLYMNNYGGQVNDAALGDFIRRAKPDMLSFDVYPFKSDYTTHQPSEPAHGSPTAWYNELRRYRAHALPAGLPVAIYRQTFHAEQDYDKTIYRDPSPSEMNLNTFAALAFNVKYFIDFTYNTGASSLFTKPGGDSHPTARYEQLTRINHRARTLGRALVRLKPIDDLRRQDDAKESQPTDRSPISDDLHFKSGFTTSILFIRGRWGAGKANEVNPLPSDFLPDPQAPSDYSWWEQGKNDPYLVGWSRTNLGQANDGQPGDVILAWFEPLQNDATSPSPGKPQRYLMVVNGLTHHAAAAEECRQKITLDFLQKGAGGSKFPGLLQLDADKGAVRSASLTNIGPDKLRLNLTLNGGDAVLLKIGDEGRFVGFSR